MKPTIAIDNTYIESWKQKGGKVVGTVCCHIPEEIIHAAGMLPVRIRGTECTDDRDGELWMTDYACGFCRACLQNLISGKYHSSTALSFRTAACSCSACTITGK